MLIAQSETAINHFHLVVEKFATTEHKRIVAYIQAHPQKPDWTIGELAHGMEINNNVISARRHELLDLFILERSEKRHCSISGVYCETVKVKEAV